MNLFSDVSDSDLSDKERIILNAACMVFSQKGFSAATTNEIAKAAGIAEGTIFRYYSTKKNLLKALLIRLTEIFTNDIAFAPIQMILDNAKGKTPEQVLKEIFDNRLQLANKNFPLIKVIFTEALYHEDIRNILYENLISKVQAALEAFYTKMLESNSVRKLPPDMVMKSISGTILFFIVSTQMFDHGKTPKTLDSDIDVLIDIIINGLGKKIQ